jgi:hypothetical protein
MKAMILFLGCEGWACMNSDGQSFGQVFGFAGHATISDWQQTERRRYNKAIRVDATAAYPIRKTSL